MPILNSLGKKEAIMNPEGTKTAKNLEIFLFPLASLKVTISISNWINTNYMTTWT